MSEEKEVFYCLVNGVEDNPIRICAECKDSYEGKIEQQGESEQGLCQWCCHRDVMKQPENDPQSSMTPRLNRKKHEPKRN